MPVFKFRSIEEVDQRRQDLWSDGSDPAWFQRVARLWSRTALLNPRSFPTGVRKYRTIEEAQAERDQWLRQHVEALIQARHPPQARDHAAGDPAGAASGPPIFKLPR